MSSENKIYKYRTQWDDTIERFEIAKETPKQIVYIWYCRGFAESNIRETREAKRSEYQNWHDTFEEAQSFLIDTAESKIANLKRRIDFERSNIEKIKKIKDQLKAKS